MVRARCRYAAAGVPPGRTNEVSGARCCVQGVDVALEPFDLARQHPQALRLALALGHREIGAEIEQVVLDQAQHRIEFARLARCSRTTPMAALVSSTVP